MVDLTTEIKLRFQISPAKCGRLPLTFSLRITQSSRMLFLPKAVMKSIALSRQGIMSPLSPLIPTEDKTDYNLKTGGD